MTTSEYMVNRKQYLRPQAILFSENSGETSNNIYVPSGYEVGNNFNLPGSFIVLSDHGRNSLDFGVQRIENRQRMVNGRMRSYWIADKRTLSVSWDVLPSRSYRQRPNFNTPIPISGVTSDSTTTVNYKITIPTSDTTSMTNLFANTNTVTIKGIISSTNTSGTDNTGLNSNSGTVVGTVNSITSGTNTIYTIPVTIGTATSETWTSGGFIYLSGTPKIGDSSYNRTINIRNEIIPEYTIDGGAGGAELLDWYQKHYGTFYVFLAYDKFTEFGTNDAAYAHLSQYQEKLEMYITDFTYSVQKRGGSNFDMWNITMTLEEA